MYVTTSYRKTNPLIILIATDINKSLMLSMLRLKKRTGQAQLLAEIYEQTYDTFAGLFNMQIIFFKKAKQNELQKVYKQVGNKKSKLQLRRDFVSNGCSHQRYTCACLCVLPAPSPSTEPVDGDGCSRETAGGRLLSCLALITRHGNRQTTNVSACKFAETRLTVTRQHYPIA